MFTVESFADCVRLNLKERRFGKERADKIVGDFEARAKAYVAGGKSTVDAGSLAMKDIFDNMSLETAEKAKRTAKMLAVQSENRKVLEQAKTIDTKPFTLKDATGKQEGPRGSRGEALARGFISLIENDPRFTTISYATKKDIYRGQLTAVLGDVLDKISKGAFARQKGKAHLPNIVKEVFGEHTGDVVAADVAKAWLKVSDLAVDLFNGAGGSMRRLERYLPQKQNAAKLLRFPRMWSKDMDGAIDWNKTRWPDGTVIPEADRAAVLANIYDTLTTDGALKVDDTAFRVKA